jgi:hypothetical protein
MRLRFLPSVPVKVPMLARRPKSALLKKVTASPVVADVRVTRLRVLPSGRRKTVAPARMSPASWGSAEGFLRRCWTAGSESAGGVGWSGVGRVMGLISLRVMVRPPWWWTWVVRMSAALAVKPGLVVVGEEASGRSPRMRAVVGISAANAANADRVAAAEISGMRWRIGFMRKIVLTSFLVDGELEESQRDDRSGL